MVTVAALLAALLLAACGRSTSSTLPPVPKSGVDLITSAGPTCPVQGISQACSRPLSARVVVRAGSGAVVTTVQTGGDGKARVPLSPGTYRLEPQGLGTSLPRAPFPSMVTVTADTFTTVRITYDTGIR
jgi:hypothetical protein